MPFCIRPKYIFLQKLVLILKTSHFVNCCLKIGVLLNLPLFPQWACFQVWIRLVIWTERHQLARRLPLFFAAIFAIFIIVLNI